MRTAALMRALAERPHAICTNCIMDTSDPGIIFDDRGQCDHCNNFYNHILPNWHPDEVGARKLERIVDQIKRDGKGRKHDCLIGISGGVDSSYLTYYATEKLGLRPLIFHVDAGWNSQEAVNNIERLVEGLTLDLYTEVVDWLEMQDLQLAYLKSQVAYIDTPQDLAFFSALYNFAVRHRFKYILTGANISTECVRQPIDWTYWGTDLRHVRDIHRRFGKRPLTTFPMASIFRYKIYDRVVRGMRVVKPLDMIPYVKADAVKLLEERFGWQTYPHKHYESRATRLIESYWMPVKFGWDNRRAHFSSMVLTKQMTRDEALARIAEKGYSDDQIAHDIEYFASKLGISVDEFHSLMAGETKTWRDYKNMNWAISLGQRVQHGFGVQRMMIR